MTKEADVILLQVYVWKGQIFFSLRFVLEREGKGCLSLRIRYCFLHIVSESCRKKMMLLPPVFLIAVHP